MNYISEINRILEELEKTLFSDFGIYLIVLVCGSLFTMIASFVDNSSKGWKVGTIVLFVGLSSTTYVSFSNWTTLNDELKTATNSFYGSKEAELEVEIQDIITSISVSDEFCIEMKVDEQCYFLEFVSTGKYTQAFVPMRVDNYAHSKGDISIFVYDWTEEEYEFVKKEKRPEDFIFRRQYRVKEDSWAIASRIQFGEEKLNEESDSD